MHQTNMPLWILFHLAIFPPLKNRFSAQAPCVESPGDLLKKTPLPSNLASENPVDRGAWWVTVHGVAKNWT